MHFQGCFFTQFLVWQCGSFKLMCCVTWGLAGSHIVPCGYLYWKNVMHSQLDDVHSLFQSCSALSLYGSIWLYSGFVCGVIKFVIVSLCLINEHQCQWGMRNNSECIWKIHVLAYIFLLSLVHRQASKRFARICLTFKALVNGFPKNLCTQRVTWSKFPPEDPQSFSDLWTLPLSGAFCLVHV
jgi:hypothetical protein